MSGKVPVFLETPKINSTHDYHYPNCWGQQSGQCSAHRLSVIIRQHFKSLQSKQELHAEIKMGAGAGKGQPGGGWGTQSVVGHWAGPTTPAVESGVCRRECPQQAFLGTPVSIWMDMPLITPTIIMGTAFPVWTCLGGHSLLWRWT